MKNLKFYFKFIIYYLTNNIISSKDIGKSFDRISNNYDSIYLKQIINSSTPMLDEIINKLQSNTKEDLNILDLGCATGFNSNYIYSKLKTGTYILVDISKGMLNNAKSNCDFNCVFVESDMLAYLNKCSDNSMDVIICSYAISYNCPKKIIKECCRVLKNGGFFGVIDNLKGTLPELKKLYPKLLVNHQDLVNKLIVKLPYSRNEYFFEKMFVDNRFNRINLKSDSHMLNFNNKTILCDFLCTSGVLSPLDSAIDLEHPRVKSTLSNLLDYYNINNLTHKYIWGSFRNDK